MTEDRLVTFADATVERPGLGPVLVGLSWSLRAGRAWAVTGPTGAGKTTLAEAVAGRLRVSAGEVSWPLLGDPAASVRLVGFKEESHQFSYARHYYQQRFNFIEPHDDLTLADFLGGDTDAARAAADRLGVGGLLSRSFIQLSNGQARRARIAKAMLAHPRLLVLDDPFVGLDAAGRETVADVLGGLVRDGQALLLVTRADAVPGLVTDVLELPGRDAGRAGGVGEEKTSPPAPPRSGEGRNAKSLPVGDQDTHRERTPTEGRPLSPPPRFGEGAGGRGEAVRPPEFGPNPGGGGGAGEAADPVIALRDVTVAYGGRPILDGVSWEVRAGERWALVGPNGSGKSTLLSLLCGDHPQAYSNDVRLFGRRRGTGETIWEVKRQVGLLSPELHLYFTEPLTAFEAAVTGFHDVVARRPATPAQADAVRGLFDEFGIAAIADRPFARLSAGQQRLVLLARALVKRPPLLILDEPFQGLDPATADACRDWLDQRVGPDQTLVFVTHLPAEVPASVTRLLRLEAGRVAEVL